ncbi:MAG: hypothetical protein AAFY76_03115, partial [Cyanobacteria bacterium J06649_11]
MKFTRMKYFSISGLFGSKEVHIPFEEDVKILIGENGLGKTQVLNIFYYTLTRNFQKLTNFPFTSVKFKIGRKVYAFSNEELVECFSGKKFRHPVLKEIRAILGPLEFEKLLNRIINTSPSSARGYLKRHPAYSSIVNLAPAEYIIELLKEEIYGIRLREGRRKSDQLSENIQKCVDALEEFIGDQVIMYFPTFRRVEEDLHNLGYSEEQLRVGKEDSRLIHFGMDDVQ